MLNYIRQRYHPLWRLRKMGLFRWFQSHFDFDYSFAHDGITVWGKWMRDFSIICSKDGNEVQSLQAFKDLVIDRRIELFFDIGANIGLYSWSAVAQRVGQVFLFEPDLNNCRLLLKTIRDNAIKGSCVIPMAMSSQIGMASFYPDAASGATGSLKDNSGNGASLHSAYGMGMATMVPTIMLDAFVELAEGKRTFVKIDVEGAEMDVITGGMNFIERVKPIIMMESFDRAAVAKLEALGYSSKALGENHNYLLMPTLQGTSS